MDRQATEQLATLNRQLGDLISIYRDAINHMGVSENEYWTWHTLVNMDGDFSQLDICNMWSLSKQTINTVVANMVKKGYATLEVVPGSRNRKNIRLTEAGRKYGLSIVTPITCAEQRAFEKVPLEVRLACSLALEKYLTVLKQELSLVNKNAEESKEDR